MATGICRRIGNKTSTYERLSDYPVISNISFKTRKTLELDRYGPGPLKYYKLRVVYVPIATLNHSYTFSPARTYVHIWTISLARRRRAAPQRHRRILVFRFRSRDAFFLCSWYPLISDPRRSTAHRHTAPFCFRIFLLLPLVVRARSYTGIGPPKVLRAVARSRCGFLLARRRGAGGGESRGSPRLPCQSPGSQDYFFRTRRDVSRRYVRRGGLPGFSQWNNTPLNESPGTCVSC